MTIRCRAFVRDEGTSETPYFIYVEAENHGRAYAVRFGQKDVADRVCAALNKAYADEGRLLVYEVAS